MTHPFGSKNRGHVGKCLADGDRLGERPAALEAFQETDLGRLGLSVEVAHEDGGQSVDGGGGADAVGHGEDLLLADGALVQLPVEVGDEEGELAVRGVDLGEEQVEFLHY